MRLADFDVPDKIQLVMVWLEKCGTEVYWNTHKKMTPWGNYFYVT